MAQDIDVSKRIWNRRWRAWKYWAVGLVASYYTCMFAGKDLAWFTSFAQWWTYGIGTIILGLTITNAVFDAKNGGKNGA